TNNVIDNNTISGNISAGIAINGANGNIIRSNKIGTNPAGTQKVPNNYGIAIDNGSNTTIGGASAGNLISGNTSGGIVITNVASAGNQIMGNLVGTDISGNDTIPNGSGIMLAGSKSTVIGGNTPASRNIISGNHLAGIVMNGNGTRDNIISGNYIGTNISGSTYLSNHTGIMFKAQSNHNTVGGLTAGDRNIISGNLEIGVYVESSDSNTVVGNYIGPDVSGANILTMGDSVVQGNGIELNTVSRYNKVGGSTPAERNVISGNRVYGLVYYGNSSNNNTSGNYIGTDATGMHKLANATGICVDGGSNHNIINNNVLSGNKSYGIFFVTTGTYYNEFKGNKVGVNASASDTVPNYIGVIVAAGTRYNTIGGTAAGEANIITGNYYDGIEIADYGTDHNQIVGNQIGSVNPSIPGNYNGIGIATNPKNNLISNNTIVNNKFMGMILFEHADSNQILNNNIGTDAGGITDLGNGTAGIAIVQGASSNLVKLNVIAYNDTAGVIISDNNTLNNTLSQNAIHHNGLIGIDIFPFGFNTNDAGDPDTGPNLMMNSPVFTSTIYNPADGKLWLNGTIDYNYISPQGILIEIFKSVGDTLGYGQALQYLGNAVVDASGHWFNTFPGAVAGEKLVATATDIYGNTSEFSPNSDIVSGIEDLASGNTSFSLFPNPASEACSLQYLLTEPQLITARLYSIDGRFISTLFSENLPVSSTYKSINTGSFPNGVYFIELSGQDFKKNIKLIVSK
ncbi:MAG: right-handed parallel beta-helix repeat-containing protein, partial [Bacteroidota bacterium]